MSDAPEGQGAREGAASRQDESTSLPFPVVGIGASAGGLEGFTQLLEHLPPDTGMAFVFIQHLTPHYRTVLPEILARSTSMPVIEAGNDMQVEPNHVYVIPPGSDMTIFHGRLNLMEASYTR